METANNNVIYFPQNKIVRNNKNINDEIVDNNMLFIKMNHINETLSMILPLIFNNIELAGFSLTQNNESDDDINIKDGTLIVEAVRSLLCKYYGLYHPFQEIANNVFDEENDYEILPQVNIEFNSKLYDKNTDE